MLLDFICVLLSAIVYFYGLSSKVSLLIMRLNVPPVLQYILVPVWMLVIAASFLYAMRPAENSGLRQLFNELPIFFNVDK